MFIVFKFELSYLHGPEIVYVLGLTRYPTFDQFSDSAAHRRREFMFLSSPLDLFVHHSLVRLVARETQLGYLHRLRRTMIDILIKFASKLLYVDAKGLPVSIKFIGEVFETCPYDVFVDRNQSILNG